MNKESLFYLCSVIESISQDNGIKKKEVVQYLGSKGIEHIYEYADVFHCLPLAQSTDEISQCYHIPKKSDKDDKKRIYVWDSGEVYSRLIEDISTPQNWVAKLQEVYQSWICDYLDDVNLPIYWQPRSYIKECYLQNKIL